MADNRPEKQATAFDARTGEAIPEDQLDAALQAGQAAFHKDANVILVDQHNVRHTVTGSEVPTLLAAGYQVEAPRLQREQTKAEKYGAVGQQLVGGAEAVARGVTFGLSTPLEVALGADPEAISARQRELSIVAPAAELAGAIAPAFVSGGSSLGLRGATALARGAAGAGRATARGVSKALGEGAAARALGGAAGAGLEGALYGAGSGVSEAVLQQISDLDLFAEKVLASATSGLLIGGGLGAIGGLVARRAKRPTTPGPLDDYLEQAPKAASKTAEIPGAVVSAKAAAAETKFGAFQRPAPKIDTPLQPLEGAPTTAAAALEAAQPKGWMQKTAQSKAVKSITGNYIGPQKEADRIGRDLIGRKVLDADLPLSDPVKTFEAASKKVDEAVDRLQLTMKEAGDVRIDRQQFEARVREQVDALKNIPDPDAHKLANQIWNKTSLVRKDLKKGKQYTAKEWWDIRKEFDKHVDWKATKSSAERDAFLKLRRTYDDTLTEAVDRAGPKAKADWELAKQDFHVFKYVSDTAKELANRREANRAFSMSDYLSMGSFSPGAALVGAAVGHPISGIAAGFATGAASALVNKTLRERGNAFMAKLLDSASRSDLGVGRSASALVQGRSGPFKLPNLPSAAKRAVVPTALTGKRLSEAYTERVASVQELQDPDAMAERLQVVSGSLQDFPDVAVAIAMLTQRANEFLSQAIPEPFTRESYSITPSVEDAFVTPADQVKFLRAARAIDDPFSVIEDVIDGILDWVGINAVKAVYPKLFDEMRMAIVQEASTLAKPLGFQRRTLLTLAFDLPAETSLEPEKLGIVQAINFLPKEQQPPPQGGKMSQTDKDSIVEQMELPV